MLLFTGCVPEAADPAPAAENEEETAAPTDSGASSDTGHPDDTSPDTETGSDSAEPCVPEGTDWCDDGIDQACDGAAWCAPIVLPDDAGFILPTEDYYDVTFADAGDALLVGSGEYAYRCDSPIAAGTSVSVTDCASAVPNFGHALAAYGDGGIVVTDDEGVYLFEPASDQPVLTMLERATDVTVGGFLSNGEEAIAVTDDDDNSYHICPVYVIDSAARGTSTGVDYVARIYPTDPTDLYTPWGCSLGDHVGDTDGDGVDDLLIGALYRGPLEGDIHDSDGDATFSGGSAFPAGDIDGDGRDDIALLDDNGATLVRATGTGETGDDVLGSAVCPLNDTWSHAGRSTVVADLNHDGAADVVLPKLPEEGFWIGHGPFDGGTADCYDSGQLITLPRDHHHESDVILAAPDMDEDGASELVITLGSRYPDFYGAAVIPSALLGRSLP